jgi:hypothetical protein
LVVALTFLGYGAAGAGSATRQNCSTNLSIHVSGPFSIAGSLVSVGKLPDGGYRVTVLSGKKFTMDFTASGGSHYYWEILSGGPPPGLTFSWGVEENGAAKQSLSGVPASPDILDAFTFTVGVADWTNFGTPAATINGYSTGNCPVAGQKTAAVAVVDFDPVATEVQVAVADITRAVKDGRSRDNALGKTAVLRAKGQIKDAVAALGPVEAVAPASKLKATVTRILAGLEGIESDLSEPRVNDLFGGQATSYALEGDLKSAQTTLREIDQVI